MSEIEEAVAKAIEARLIKGFELGDFIAALSGGMVRFDGKVDTAELARAAIEAYEAAKKEAEEMSETVVTDKFGREFTVRWPKSQEVNVMGIDFVVWDAVP